MNMKLVSKEFLFPCTIAICAFTATCFAVHQIFSVNYGLADFVLNILWSIMGCFAHEKIARCNSPLIERALRFGTYAFLLMYLPILIASLGGAAEVVSSASQSSGWFGQLAKVRGGSVPTFSNFHILLWLFSHWMIFVVSFAPAIHLLYKLDPKGGGPFFSVSAKFQK